MTENTRWESPFDAIEVPGTKPRPEPQAQIVFAKMVFDSTLLGYLCWTEEFDAVAWYPTVGRDDTGWSIVSWVEDQLLLDEDIATIIFRILEERGFAVEDIDRDLHMNIASDAAIDHRL